jgi:Signal transduction histidine kinase
MRLSEFIHRDIESIVHGWRAHVTTVMPRSPRGHELELLQLIVAGLAHAGTLEVRTAHPIGPAPAGADAKRTAAQAHAVSRAESGYTVEQLAFEYRALRSSVLNGWIEACRPEPPLVEDIIRFDDAIDQALGESIRAFSAHVSRARNLLLGMLSHDLRSPLQTIQMTARALQRLHVNADVDHAAELLVRSGARMKRLVDEQIDFSRIELGLGLGVKPLVIDLGSVCNEELEHIRAAHADHALDLEVTGDCSGAWDSGRVQQMLNNLVVNAVQYGEPEGPIHVTLHGAASDVCLTVANAGEAIDGETLARIFEPMRRGKTGVVRHDSGLGLGLYIAQEIAKAHGGAIAAESKGRQTVFTVVLPKGPQSAGSRD